MQKENPTSATLAKFPKDIGNGKEENVVKRKFVKKTKSESALHTNKGHANRNLLKAKLSCPVESTTDSIQNKLKIEPTQMRIQEIKSDAPTSAEKKDKIRVRKLAWVLHEDNKLPKGRALSSQIDMKSMRTCHKEPQSNNNAKDSMENSNDVLKKEKECNEKVVSQQIEGQNMTENKEMVNNKKLSHKVENDINLTSLKQSVRKSSVKSSLSDQTEAKLVSLRRDSEIRQFIHIKGKGKEINKRQLKKMPPSELLNWKMRAKLEEEAHDRVMLWQKMKSSESPKAAPMKDTRRVPCVKRFTSQTKGGPNGHLVRTSVQGTSIKLRIKSNRTSFSFPPSIEGRNRLPACS